MSNVNLENKTNEELMTLLVRGEREEREMVIRQIAKRTGMSVSQIKQIGDSSKKKQDLYTDVSVHASAYQHIGVIRFKTTWTSEPERETIRGEKGRTLQTHI